MNFKTTVAALAAACALGGASAEAAVVYSNFGPDYGFQLDHGYHSHADRHPGMLFKATFDADVAEIRLALANITGVNSATVSLWTKDLSVQLGSWVVTDTVPDHWPLNSPAKTPTKISGITGVHLTAGAEYVLFAGHVSNSYNYWLYNNIGDLGGSTTNKGNTYDGAPQYLVGGRPAGAFEILSRDAVVPEPSAWAMMIVGFGGVGAVLRRRRLAPA